MVKHQPLQYYEPQLCLSCLTGIYGCRWKRYQRSHDSTTKWERLWFLILCTTFFMTLVWFYFWWEVHNDYNEFNWYMYNKKGYWNDWSVPVLVLASTGFIYVTFLLILALCHIAVGQQMNLHWLHKVGLTVVLVAILVAVISVNQLWNEEWDIIFISFQATAPFLHIGAVAAATILAWLIAGQFARSEKVVFQIFLLFAYLGFLVALYLVPLIIYSPCIMKREDLSRRPTIIGNRGVPMLAPENTLMSFQKAAEWRADGFNINVTISYDGVPFLIHDTTLRRTTNVEELYPNRVFDNAAMFNWTNLQMLNAGLWFFQEDPFWTAQALSQKDNAEALNQSLCRLADVLSLAVHWNKSVMVNLRRPPPEHPFYTSWINVTLETILESGIAQDLVIWLPEEDRWMVRQVAPGFQQMSSVKQNATALHEQGIMGLNLRYNKVNAEEVREYASENISTNLYLVNEPWLFSVLWCAGVRSVTSDACQVLSEVRAPTWIMSPGEYYMIWITSDVISITIVVGIFILQNYHLIRWRLGTLRTYNPEQIMLSAAVRRSSKDVNIMKEKLIFAEINNGVSNSDNGSLCSESGFEGFADDVSPLGRNRTKTRID
ncbi:glycerophosphodiester phosphodiesterase domain-containing protein 5 isoform X1 [Stegostoma tigrinum]|uniref:glycerophosphodiester phosphodiesterase domain-containing protein 5 isoform X1 n=2 Tax=Stegostoma tigrinum TaxID=3053191 RepID=UPI00202B33D1|nr:glycerophosphodiester phosphodiesterase domain-containing protein 5 isoform X1 [Stegostoma tigrinum]XP_048389509.1 glycerophosphodiester phosphodiesterase domain-containing protein 5 isoform X1 [Stegostoma tigrinum]XP_059502823.1 glycerophosphodiester phosphodiesterase domain-containing protein 5 isoform X1 [Stegostoma tigrinum]